MKIIILLLPVLLLYPSILLSKTLDSLQQKLVKIEHDIDTLNHEKVNLLKEISRIKSSKQKEIKEKDFIEPLLNIHFTLVEGGCFLMGDQCGSGDGDEKPVHNVCVDSFYIGTYEVTQAQYKRAMRKNPSAIKNIFKPYPVESVSWLDTQVFIKKLNKHSKKTFRLPTEAEWEYAARSGGRDLFKFAGSDDVNGIAWGQHNDAGYIKPVGQKQPNSMGLYDMSGNVSEWCADWYSADYYQTHEHQNPKGPRAGKRKVTRGGSFKSFMHQLRITDRYPLSPKTNTSSVGFRLVCIVDKL